MLRCITFPHSPSKYKMNLGPDFCMNQFLCFPPDAKQLWDVCGFHGIKPVLCDKITSKKKIRITINLVSADLCSLCRMLLGNPLCFLHCFLLVLEVNAAFFVMHFPGCAKWPGGGHSCCSLPLVFIY